MITSITVNPLLDACICYSGKVPDFRHCLVREYLFHISVTVQNIPHYAAFVIVRMLVVHQRVDRIGAREARRRVAVFLVGYGTAESVVKLFIHEPHAHEALKSRRKDVVLDLVPGEYDPHVFEELLAFLRSGEEVILSFVVLFDLLTHDVEILHVHAISGIEPALGVGD
ncbi:MAG: hypothetical protein U5N86_10225 [Planctomycetota bacterium]|nr:hypothetical protein [Planctomycetota bacterium]